MQHCCIPLFINNKYIDIKNKDLDKRIKIKTLWAMHPFVPDISFITISTSEKASTALNHSTL